MVTTIVGCSKSKVDTDNPIPAEELYDSAYFNKRMKVAKQYDDVRILSAKYGLIDTDEKIPEYDVSVYDLKKDEKEEIIESIPVETFDEVVKVYAGKKYTELVEEATEKRVVMKPLDGGIGEQLAQLNEIIDENNL